KAATDRVRALKLEMDATDEPTKKMVRAFEAAKKEAGELKDKHGELIARQQTLRAALGESGISTTDLAAHQKRLKTDIAAATGEFERQSTALSQHNEKMRKTIAAQAEYKKLIDFRNRLATGGAVTMATGAAMGMPFLAASREYANFEDAMLGVAKQMNGARDANGNLTQSYHDMAKAIKAMSEELPMSAKEIAAIVEAGARMGIQGKADLLTYARQTTVMSTALGLSVEQTGENMATIAGLYKVPISNIKELGDTINFLDDNTRSKGDDIIDVMKRIGGTMDGKMNFRESAALGSTFLSLGAGAEVAASATSAMVRELSIATMQGKRFKDGLAMIGLGAGDVKRGMSTDASGTILRVMEAIKALPKESQLEATTRLFGKEYGDDAAKLAGNLQEYRLQLALVNDAQAKGSMDLEMGAKLQSQSAQKKLLDNTFDNLSSDIGESLKSPLMAVMKEIKAVIQGMREWAAANPELVAVLSKVGAGIAAFTTAVGAAGVALSAVLGPLALAKLSMAKLGIAAPGLAGKLGAILGPIGKVTAAFGAGYWAGTQLLEGINALISKLTGKNNTLGGWIFDMVQKIKTSFGDLVTWFKSLPSEIAKIGNALVDGIIGGIKARMAALKSTVTGVGHETVAWLKNTLGIKSPSRVFEELGIYTMKGLEHGISGGQGAPLAAIARMAKQMGAAGAGMMLSTGAALANIDHRPPLAGGAMGGGYTIVNQITIHAAPGMNERTLAEEVARQIDMIERAKAARGRSLLGDRA
ncbi:MAG: phage tail tape measure protein, partial [Gammaproteobacteria bacterium]|nr:phage tail tape measure protein [Gammaproteobacteria bacterium]